MWVIACGSCGYTGPETQFEPTSCCNEYACPECGEVTEVDFKPGDEEDDEESKDAGWDEYDEEAPCD